MLSYWVTFCICSSTERPVNYLLINHLSSIVPSGRKLLNTRLVQHQRLCPPRSQFISLSLSLSLLSLVCEVRLPLPHQLFLSPFFSITGEKRARLAFVPPLFWVILHSETSW